MKYNYQYRIVFKDNEPFDMDHVNQVCEQYPNSKILIEVQNTKGISSGQLKQLESNMIIRVAGGYDEERVRRYENAKFVNGETGQYFVDAVIYTRNETIKVLEEIEKIESGINKNWSDIQKAVYVYDRLKTGIMYDPKFEYKFSDEIRSLRGLLTKQTVCAGYAMIFKEIMDRNGIDCEYVEGYTCSNKTNPHAWNIINIDGKKYPIDLTWDNTAFRAGKSKSFKWLGQNVEKFSKTHYPMEEEKTQNYQYTLSEIDPKIVQKIQSQINRTRGYQSTTYYGIRNDGTKYIVAQVGDATIDSEKYYRYYYVDILPDGRKQLPLVLYGETNLTRLVDCKKFKKPIPPNYEERVDEILFSPTNIADSIEKGTYYIGGVRKSGTGNKLELISSVQDIHKPEEKKNLFMFPTKTYTRSDGSTFIAQQMLEQPFEAKGVNVMQYDIFEMVNEDGKQVLKKNTVFTERNFFKDNRQSMVDAYLSRDRLDRKALEAGGYIGHYDANGMSIYNPDLVSYFGISKKIDIDLFDRKTSVNNTQSGSIPSFEELKALASKYEIMIDSENPLEPDPSKFKIRDLSTGQIQTDKTIVDRAMFANIWLSSAGVKYYEGESRPGENYAFNESAKELYHVICSQLSDSSKSNGVIDTVGLFGNIEDHNSYKYNREIIVNLFRTPYQAKLINKLFLSAQGLQAQGQMPEPLYSMNYAGNLAYTDHDHHSTKGK